MFLNLMLASLRKQTRLFHRKEIWQIARCLKSNQPAESEDKPVKFSASKAGTWKAKYSQSGKAYYETPRFQPMILSFTLGVFLLYFCVLREENDWDDRLREIEQRVPIQLEEATLRSAIENGKRNKIDTTYQQKRLQELIEKRQQLALNQANNAQ